MPTENLDSDSHENNVKKRGRPRKDEQPPVLIKEEIIEPEELESVSENAPEIECQANLPELTDISEEKRQSRYGRVRKNRSLGPDIHMEPIVKPKPTKSGGSQESTPTKEESPKTLNPPKKIHSFPKSKVDKVMNAIAVTQELKIGDMIWARIPGHPWWPCIISEDPIKKTYVKSRSKKGSKDSGVIYHVYYFGKVAQRGWTLAKNILLFDGKERFNEFIKDLVDKSPEDQKEVVISIFRIHPSRLTTWKEAVVEAEKYIQFSPEERLQKLLPIFAQANPPKSASSSSEKSTPTKQNHDRKSPINVNEAALTRVEPSPEDGAKKSLNLDDSMSSLSKYKMKTYFENYLSEHLEDMITGGLTDEEAKDLLLIKWNEFTDNEKEMYKKRKGNLCKSKLTPPPKKKKESDEPLAKERNQMPGPASKTRGRFIGDISNVKPLVSPENSKKDKDNAKSSNEVKEVSPSDYSKKLVPTTKNGVSPRKVTVFIVESDSDDSFSDSGLEEDKPGLDEHARDVKTKPNPKETEAASKKNKAADEIKSKAKSIEKNTPAKDAPDKMVNSTTGDSETEPKKNNYKENPKKDVKVVMNHEKYDKIIKKANMDIDDPSRQITKQLKVVIKKEDSENGSSFLAAKSLKRVFTEKPKQNFPLGKSTEEKIVTKTDERKTRNSTEPKPKVDKKMDESKTGINLNKSSENSALLPSSKNLDEEERQQNCNEIIESVGLKKISATANKGSDSSSNDRNKTGRIGTRRYVKSRMDEVDNKTRKNDERLNGEKFPTDVETGALNESPPPKKPKFFPEIKTYSKPKARLLLKSKEDKDVKAPVEENKPKSTVNGSELKNEEESKSKKPSSKKGNDNVDGSKTDLVTKTSSKPPQSIKTEAQLENNVDVSQRKRGRPRKSKDEPTTDVSTKVEECSKKDNTASPIPKTVLKTPNTDARKRKGSQVIVDVSFNKYLHNNILNVMESNPNLSYAEAKAVIASNWEKMTDEEKLSHQCTKDDAKENVSSKKAKLVAKTLEGIESEEEVQIESVDGETGAVLINRHERLCQICEVSGDVVTCKGPCQQNFHIGCLNSKPDNIATFQCDECANNCHTCFTCKSNEGEVRKCTITNCGKFYHIACLRQSPLSTVMENKVICPLHVCLSCYNDNPKLARGHKGRLVRCIRCPTAFHSAESCVAAGSIHLTQTHILCTHHFTPKKNNKHHSHSNVNWCFICSAGGELICCESCPGAFHAECLEIVPPDGSYYCQDCKLRKHPTSGNIVWVKLGCYRWWPAEVCHPNNVPLNIQKLEHSVGEFPVRFFGSHDYFWVHKGRVFLFQEGDKGSRDTASNRYLARVFQKAVDEAIVAFKNWQKTKRAREVTHGSSKPPSYKHIKSNKPVGKVQIHVADIANLTRCECDSNATNPCARDTDCLNRLLHLECHPSVCPAGDKCQNQDFVKRNYPPAIPKKVEDRGWGLFALTSISKGQFVSEYVGELIDEEECQKRLKNMHTENDTNFYFLTIDKDRIIDAGPKGNLSRFMNHSCQPNCETQKWMVNGDTRVGLFAAEDIEKGAELTFNYNLECRGDEKTKCGCGAPNCSGFIGVRPKTPAAISAEKKFKENIGKKKKRKIPATRKHEDECYRCGEGGELLMCDKKGCTKSYHLFCLKLDKPPHGRWECPWHHCDSCGKNSVVLCTECPNSYCNIHATPDNITSGEKVICSEHETEETEKLPKNEVVDEVNADVSSSNNNTVQSETDKIPL